jgi:hypothetical protein
MVGGFFPDTLYNVSGFSRLSIEADRHHITEKLLSIVKNSKQTTYKTYMEASTLLVKGCKI